MNGRKVNFVICFLAAMAVITPTYVSLENNLDESQNASLSGPILAFYPMSHDFGYVQEGELHYTIFQIWNNGTGTLIWNLTFSQPWIYATPINGSSEGEHCAVTVKINTTGLSPGLYAEQIIINSNSIITAVMNIFTINFTINHPPNIPSKPVGPTSVTEGIPYTYQTSTIDPDGDNIKYGFDFHNDGVVLPHHWTSFFPSGITCSVNVIFYGTGIRYIRVKAEDVHGAQSDFSPPLTVVVHGSNNPPKIPNKPLGPNVGNITEPLTFLTNTTDPDGDDIKYGWDWNGNGTIDEWSDFMASGSYDIRSHVYTSAGTYHVRVIAEDEHGARSAFSLSKIIVVKDNNPPNKPSMPTGPIYGRIGITYSYTSLAIDPEGDNLEYLFDWGDGSDSGWIGPYNSGDAATVSHTWNTRGTFPVKVKARDSYGAESVWSDSLPVGMPKSREFFNVNYQFLDIYQAILDFIQSFKIS